MENAGAIDPNAERAFPPPMGPEEVDQGVKPRMGLLDLAELDEKRRPLGRRRRRGHLPWVFRRHSGGFSSVSCMCAHTSHPTVPAMTTMAITRIMIPRGAS